MDFGIDLIVTLTGLGVAGLAAVLGIWMERDERKPPRYAWALSILIVMATLVGVFQTYNDALSSAKMEKDMARMLAQLDKIAATSEVEIPELNAFLKSELESASKANPDIVAEFAQRVADDGGDPTAVLTTYLPPSDVEGLNRDGLDIKPKAVEARPEPEGGAVERRKTLTFGGKIDLDKAQEEKEVAAKSAAGRDTGRKPPPEKTEEAAPEEPAPSKGGREKPAADKPEAAPAPAPKPAAAPAKPR